MNVSDEKGALFRIKDLSYPEKQTREYYQKQTSMAMENIAKMVSGMVAAKIDMVNEKSSSATPTRRYESTETIEINPMTIRK